MTTRRRGEALEAAILDATLAELAEVGFEALTLEHVARRAGAGKASLYHRWSNPADLVAAALARAEAQPGARPADVDHGSLRADLLALLGELVAGLRTPAGRALLPLMARAADHPQLYRQVNDLMVRPRQDLVASAVRRAVDRGELPPGSPPARALVAGPQMLIMTHLTTGRVTEEDVAAVVDQVVLPALGATAATHPGTPRSPAT